MRFSSRQFLAAILLVACYAGGLRIIFSPFAASAASAPNIIGYQGRILNTNGVPVTDASADMIFRLYDASSDGNCLWSNSSDSCASATAMSVDLTDGMFAVELGDTADSFAAIADSLFADNAAVYLQVTIEGETLSPRTQLVAAPYALNADTLDGTDSTGFVNTTTGCTDCLDFTSFEDALNLDAATTITTGTVDFSIDVDNTGDFIVKDNGTAFASFYGTDSVGAAQIYLRPNGPTDIGAFPDIGPFLWVDGQDYTSGQMGMVWITAPELTTGKVLSIQQDVSLSGFGLGGAEPFTTDATLVDISRNFDNTSSEISGTLLRVVNSNQDDDPTVDSTTVASFYQENPNGSGFALDVRQDGTATAAKIQSIGSGKALDVDISNAASTATALAITNNGTGDSLHVAGTNTSQDAVATISGDINGSARYVTFISNEGTGTILGLQNNETGSTQPVATVSNYGDGQLLWLNDVAAGGVETTMELTADTASWMIEMTNSGNNDNRQGIRMQSCLNTNPTSACDFMRFADGDGTNVGAIEGNGSGGISYASPGSDYAELFPGALSSFAQGNVLALHDDGSVRLATANESILGAFSIAPNTLGNWKESWQESGVWVPVALLGQVPVHVSDANGPIAIGDFLTVGEVPGTVVRATGSGYVLGQALESWTAGTGTIMTLIRPGWQDVSGGTLLSSAISGADDVDALAPDASVISLAGARLTNVATIAGLNGAWEITEGGDVRIRGRFTEIVRGHNGEDVETYAMTHRQNVITLSGTAYVEQGLTFIDLQDIDPSFLQVIASDGAYQVLLTPSAGIGVAEVGDKTATSFTIRLPGGGSGAVDWLVIAQHKDYAQSDSAGTPVEEGEAVDNTGEVTSDVSEEGEEPVSSSEESSDAPVEDQEDEDPISSPEESPDVPVENEDSSDEVVSQGSPEETVANEVEDDPSAAPEAL